MSYKWNQNLYIFTPSLKDGVTLDETKSVVKAQLWKSGNCKSPLFWLQLLTLRALMYLHGEENPGENLTSFLSVARFCSGSGLKKSVGQRALHGTLYKVHGWQPKPR